MKSGNLNFLEPSGPLRACNGNALPLPLLVYEIDKSFILTFPSFAYIVLVLPEDDTTMGRNMYRVSVGNIIVLAADVLLDITS